MSNKIIIEEKYLGEIYHDKSELPKKIRIDASTNCQLDCERCYMRMDKEDAENGCGFGNLKFDDFKKFIDENDFESIELSNHGEVFLNPELDKIIEYAATKGIELTMDNGVNLNYLSDKMVETLVKYGVKRICVSIDGASQETYKIYRKNGDFNKVIKNVQKINFYKQKYNSKYPVLYYKFIVFGHNEHEIEQAKKEAEKLGVAINFATNWDESYSPVKNVQKVLEQTGLESLTTNTSPVELLKQFQAGEADWFFCNDLWQPQINWDGQLLGCCANYKKNFGGNVFEDGLMETLNNPRFVYAKNMVTHNALPEKTLPCYDCEVYQDMAKHNVWFNSPRSENGK